MDYEVIWIGFFLNFLAGLFLLLFSFLFLSFALFHLPQLCALNSISSFLWHCIYMKYVWHARLLVTFDLWLDFIMHNYDKWIMHTFLMHYNCFWYHLLSFPNILSLQRKLLSFLSFGLSVCVCLSVCLSVCRSVSFSCIFAIWNKMFTKICNFTIHNLTKIHYYFYFNTDVIYACHYVVIVSITVFQQQAWGVCTSGWGRSAEKNNIPQDIFLIIN